MPQMCMRQLCTVTQACAMYAGHLQDHFNQQSYEDRCSGTVQVLIDMELLAHTDYFVGSYNSRCAMPTTSPAFRVAGNEQL